MTYPLFRLIAQNISVPAQSLTAAEAAITRFLDSGLTKTEVTSLTDYFTSLNDHEEYLKFFGVAQVKDEKEKIKSVGRYVGLELPKIFGEGEKEG